MSSTPKNSFKPVGRKPRAPRRGRRAAGSSDEEEHSSDSASTVSDSDTLSSEDALTTPAPPDHSVSPPSKRRSKKKATEPLIPAQPTSWSELVSQEDDIHQEPPIIDFADFVSGPGPSAPTPVRGRSKPRGGKTQRQAYLERLSEDPSFIPRVGQFWGHDERLLAPELRGMSDWWRGRWNGRGRGRGRGVGRARPERPVEEPETAQSAERTWGHDGFEKMKDQERDRPQRGRGRGRGRGGRGGFVSREPEQLWTKAPDTHLHVDPSTRPQFPGQGRGIKVNLPGQWRPSIVRIGRNSKPAPARPAPTSATEVPTEIVVKLPGKQAQVVAVAGPSAPKPTVPEEPETVQPLDDVPPTPTARLPGTTAPKPAPEFIPRPAPTTALPAQVLQQPTAPAKPQVHGRTRSQLDAVAFARPSIAPTVPLAFGSLDPTPQPQPQPAPVPAPAPPVDANNPVPQDPNNPPLNIRPPMPQMASFTPPPNGYYNHNPYAYTPLDGATYYPTAQGYYPPNGFFMPPRRAPVSIRAPGESEERQVPAWNYYPQPQHGHNPYYSPSGTPYPPPPQPGYYQGGEYPGVYDYNGVYY